MKAGSVRTQLYVATITALVLTALLISAAGIAQFESAYKDAMGSRSLTIAQNLRETVYKNLEYFPLNSFSGMAAYLQATVKANEGISYAYITDKSRILYHSDESKVGAVLNPSDYAGVSFNDPNVKTTIAAGGYYESIIPIVLADEVIGTIHIGVERKVIDSKITQIIVQSAIILVVALIISVYFLYWLLSRNIVAPLANLTQTATQIAAGDLSRTVVVKQKNEIGSLAQAFNAMTSQLRQTLENLEQKVADRTAEVERRSSYLEAAAKVSRAASSILEPEQLIREVVDLIQERFGLYHVGLFLLDETGQWAEYRAGTGEAGRLILEQGLRLEVGSRSMVGWCSANAQARVAQDVRQETERVDHPLLTEARSEAALPLAARGRVIGALDAQSDQLGAFDPDTVAVLQTMCDQVAVALDNARLYVESQAALNAAQRAFGELSRQAWDELLRTRLAPGYRYMDKQVTPIGEPRQESAEGRVLSASVTVEGPVLAVPIRARDRVIGKIDLHKGEGDAEWTPNEIAMAETLADQLNVALESARLYQDTQRRATQEQLVGEVTARMRETLDIETVLRTAAQEMRQALGVPELNIRLAAPDKEASA